MAPDEYPACTCGKSLADFSTTASATDLDSCRVHSAPTLYHLSQISPKPTPPKPRRKTWESWESRFRR